MKCKMFKCWEQPGDVPQPVILRYIFYYFICKIVYTDTFDLAVDPFINGVMFSENKLVYTHIAFFVCEKIPNS